MKKSIVFGAIAPHPPILLPTVGSKEDRGKVKKTIESLEFLGKKLEEASPDFIVISAPHPDWGIKVPLHFLISKIKNQKSNMQIKYQKYQTPDDVTIELGDDLTVYPVLTTLDSPKQHHEWGQKIYKSQISKSKIAIIASGDLSHCLKEEGPYGFHPDGPKFDEKFIESLREKDVETILKLDEMYPEAGECGLRSFCFMLGIIEASGLNWQSEILSYEGPFGVGYLVANLKLN